VEVTLRGVPFKAKAKNASVKQPTAKNLQAQAAGVINLVVPVSAAGSLKRPFALGFLARQFPEGFSKCCWSFISRKTP